jgi:hypothetical protein
MTLAQALRFRAPWVNKPLRHMSAEDWSRLREKLQLHEAMMDAFWRHQWDDQMDQRAHAMADRLGDLQEAIKVIFAEASACSRSCQYDDG